MELLAFILKTKKFEKNLGKMLSGMLERHGSREALIVQGLQSIHEMKIKDIFKYSLCINDLKL